MVTASQLIAIFPTIPRANISESLEGIASCIKAGVKSEARLAVFLGQVGEETYGLRFKEEIWGPTKQQLKYDPASGSRLSRNLGNVIKGDGYKYRGRGPFMLTGRGNYRRFGKMLNLPLEENPDLVSDFSVGLRVALLYWLGKRRVLTSRGFVESVTGLELSDRGDLYGATRFVNGGLTGFDSRVRYTKRALAVLRGADLSVPGVAHPINVEAITAKPQATTKPSAVQPARVVEFNGANYAGKIGEYPVVVQKRGQPVQRTLVVDARNMNHIRVGFQNQEAKNEW